MSTLFSTNSMLAAVNSSPMTNLFLLKRFFPVLTQSTDEEIHFDVITQRRRLAPFVSPVVQGKIVQSSGMVTKTFKPAYIKDKRIFDSSRPLKRIAGESIGGTFDPLHRVERLLVLELQDQVNMIDRRLETMASEILTTGSVNIEGDSYPAQNVDFGRDPALTVTLTGANRWSDSTTSPLDDLQDWSQLILQKSGVLANDVVMSLDVWKVFRSHPIVAAELARLRSNSTLQPDALTTEGGIFMGTLHGFNIFVYSSWYVDDNGDEQPIFPAKTLVMSSAGMQGLRAFGAIRDDAAGFQALPYYPKSWTDPDPSMRYLMMQSAPLLVPQLVNGSLSATVL